MLQDPQTRTPRLVLRPVGTPGCRDSPRQCGEISQGAESRRYMLDGDVYRGKCIFGRLSVWEDVHVEDAHVEDSLHGRNNRSTNVVLTLGKVRRVGRGSGHFKSSFCPLPLAYARFKSEQNIHAAWGNPVVAGEIHVIEHA